MTLEAALWDWSAKLSVVRHETASQNPIFDIAHRALCHGRILACSPSRAVRLLENLVRLNNSFWELQIPRLCHRRRNLRTTRNSGSHSRMFWVRARAYAERGALCAPR